MKRAMTILTALGFMIQMAMSQTTYAVSDISGLERLNWLCSDYQLPVKGFVVESWFSVADRNFTDEKLEKLLGVSFDSAQSVLPDGSSCAAKRSCENGKCYVELQLITCNVETALEYEKRWQSFANRYHLCQPVGATILVEFPEMMSENAMHELADELLYSLGVRAAEFCELEHGCHAVADTAQMGEGLQIGGQSVNVNLAFRQQDHKTMLYLGTPVIYQQY